MSGKTEVPEYFMNEKNEIYKRIDTLDSKISSLDDRAGSLSNSDKTQTSDILQLYRKIFEISDDISNVNKKVDTAVEDINSLKNDIKGFRNHIDNGFQQSMVGKLATEMMSMMKKEKEDAVKVKLKKLDILALAVGGTGFLTMIINLIIELIKK